MLIVYTEHILDLCIYGRVEVLMVGEEKNIEALILWLHKGPRFAEVTGVDVVEYDFNKRRRVDAQEF